MAHSTEHWFKYIHKIISIKTYLFSVKEQKKEFVLTSEISQIEVFFNILESKLYDFQVLPWLDRRQTLVNFGGKILKALFGTATTSDIHSLHDVLNELKFQHSDISLFSQSVYLCEEIKYICEDTEAIESLSIIINNMIQLHDKFEVAIAILLLNITLFGKSVFTQ